MYEYCIMHVAFPDEPHRIPRSLEECLEWMEFVNREGSGAGVAPGNFYIGVREIHPWSKYEG